jgi:DNA-directed RNA polymerase specialized sigma24 family protein
MNFPQTQQTLIHRLAHEANEHDWHRFLNDYWQPVCRFAQHRAGLNADDAEDVAAEVFQAILQNQLLCRWASDRCAKLRTMLCTVVRHVLGNRARVQQGRKKLLKDNAYELREGTDWPTIKKPDAPVEQVDLFYEAWVEGILVRTVETMMREYHQTGKGDYFRVLYGRICEGMSMPEISRTLKIDTMRAENYFKAAKKRLGAILEEQVREQVSRYCEGEQAEEEFQAEWQAMGEFLSGCGGLETVIARVYKTFDPVAAMQRQNRAITGVMSRITGMLPRIPDKPF